MPGIKTRINMRLKQCVAVNRRARSFCSRCARMGRLPRTIKRTAVYPADQLGRRASTASPERLVACSIACGSSAAGGIGQRLAASSCAPLRPPCVGSMCYTQPSVIVVPVTWRLVAPAMFAGEEHAALPWLVRPLKPKSLRLIFTIRPSGWCHTIPSTVCPFEPLPQVVKHAGASPGTRIADHVSIGGARGKAVGLPCTFGPTSS